jgi:hypothetical protein
MESIFSHDLTLCKSILETLNLPNDQLIQITVRATPDFDNVITVYHKDIPWGPTHAQPEMFNHPQIKFSGFHKLLNHDMNSLATLKQCI